MATSRDSKAKELSDGKGRREALGLMAALATTTRRARADATPLSVVIPEPHNLQFLSFWVALGAGFFDAEGAPVTTRSPSSPRELIPWVRRGEVEAAVVPPPMYIQLMADDAPLRLVANLLQNDPINLVVRRTLAAERGLRADRPLADRLRGLAGVRLGVAPGPPRRLRALFGSVGLVADDVLRIEIVRGPEQNAAFERGQVDALFCHTPYLEHALLEQDALMLVNLSGGECPVLADRQIHTLAVSPTLIAQQPDRVSALVRAVARAQRLIHERPVAAVEAVLRALPTLGRPSVELLVRLYAPAIPKHPVVSADKVPAAVQLFPSSHEAPPLEGVDVTRFVEPRFAAEASRTTWPLTWVTGLAGLGSAALVARYLRSRPPPAG